MTAIYVSSANCVECADLGWEFNCGECVKARSQKVEVLQLGVGALGDKAIVKTINTGKLLLVRLSDLMEIDR